MSPSSQLGLGTANWGAPYGAPGHEAEVDESLAVELAQQFSDAGHQLVDTASAYGRSEELVGRAFAGREHRIVTKLSASATETSVEGKAALLRHLAAVADRTGVARLAGVLLHDPQTVVQDPRRARAVIDEIRGSGLVDRVGVSVYAPAEAVAAVEDLGADLVQLPCSLADQRFLADGCIADLVTRGVEVHVRSIFLNGVLLSRPEDLEGSLQALAPGVRRIHDAAARAGTTPLELAIAFARDAIGAHAVVVGAYTLPQLSEILGAWASNRTPESSCGDWHAFSVAGTDAIDPRTWRR